MDGLTALALLLTTVLISFYVSDKKAEEEANIEIVEQTQIKALPSLPLSSTQNISIQWWREIYQDELGYNQEYYLSTLQLGLGFRHVIVPYTQGHVKAFNKDDGKWEWSFSLGEEISTGIHMHKGLGIVGGEDGLIIAFDNLSGKERWRAAINASVMSLSSGEGAIYSYSLRGHIHALNPQTGEILWSHIGKEPNSNVYGASQVKEQGNTLYAGTGGGNLIALNKTNGQLLWHRTIGQPSGFSDLENLVDVDSNILVDDNSLYLAAFGSRLYAINPNNQLHYWQQRVSTVYALQEDTIKDFSAGAKALEVIIALSDNSHLQAYNKKTGELVWENTQAKLRSISQLTKYQGYWLGIDQSGAVLLFDRQSGELANYYQSRYGAAMNPAIAGKRFYWLSKKGELFSMHLTD